MHGGGSGSWTWHLVQDRLAKRGIDVRTPDLPSCSARDNSIDLNDDVRHVRELVTDLDEPVVLAGNSYGGYVISSAAVDVPNVRHLVYVAALMPKAGEPMMETISAAAVPADELGLSFLPDGRIVFEPETDLRSSYQLAPPDEVEWIRPHLGRPMSLGPDSNIALPRVAWDSIPSTYVVCAEDGALRPEVQRTWAKERATHFVEWPADHAPQHSQPDLLADLLERLAREF